jgi:hypothetical protein
MYRKLFINLDKDFRLAIIDIENRFCNNFGSATSIL